MRIFKSLRRKSKFEIILYCLVSALFMVVALSYLYIIVWMVIAGCKEHSEVILTPFSLPSHWHWEHYIEAILTLKVNGNTFLDMFFNSCWFTIVGTFGTQFFCLLFAYTVTKYKFPGSTHVYTFILIIMTLPLYGGSAGMYRLLYNLGLIDSYAHVLLAGGVTSANTLYYMAFFKNVSNTYMEAARMDGANDFQIYYKVMMPQAKPIFGALFLTAWIGDWNNYESPLIYLPNLPTLPVGIYQFYTEMTYRARADILFAACIIVTIPALLLFVIFNKTITTSVSFGGIKG